MTVLRHDYETVPLYQYKIRREAVFRDVQHVAPCIHRPLPIDHNRVDAKYIKAAIRKAKQDAHEWVESRRNATECHPAPPRTPYIVSLRFWWRVALWTRIAEAFSGLVAAGWAVLMLLPTQLIGHGGALGPLSLDGAQWVWGAFAATIAALWVVTIPCGAPTVRFISSAASAVFWLGISIRLYVSSAHLGIFPINTGFVVYSLMAVMCFVVLFPLSKYVVAGVVYQWEKVAYRFRK